MLPSPAVTSTGTASVFFADLVGATALRTRHLPSFETLRHYVTRAPYELSAARAEGEPLRMARTIVRFSRPSS